MKKYMNSFIKEEDGMETIEFVVILAIVAGLIAIISAVGGQVRDKAGEAQDKIEAGLNEITYD